MGSSVGTLAHDADAKQQRPCRTNRRSSHSHGAGRRRPSRTTSRRPDRRSIPTATAPERRRRCGFRRRSWRQARASARRVRRVFDLSALTVWSKKAAFPSFLPLRSDHSLGFEIDGGQPRLASSKRSDRRRRNIYRTLRMAIACSKQYSASRPAIN